MESVEVIAFLGCALLALAGAFKMKDPAPTVGAMRALHLPASLMSVRLMGFVEVVIGLVAALTGSAIAMGLVGIAYVAFVLIVLAAMNAKTQIQSCGCFGKTDTPPSLVHLGANSVFAVVALASAFKGTETLPEMLANQPMFALPFLVTFAVALYLVVLGLTVLPSSRRPQLVASVGRQRHS